MLEWLIQSYCCSSCCCLCRPQTHGEEELQLQLALAMSREEAEAEDSKKKSDDMRLQMAIQKSMENDEVAKICDQLSVASLLPAAGATGGSYNPPGGVRGLDPLNNMMQVARPQVNLESRL